MFKFMSTVVSANRRTMRVFEISGHDETDARARALRMLRGAGFRVRSLHFLGRVA